MDHCHWFFIVCVQKRYHGTKKITFLSINLQKILTENANFLMQIILKKIQKL